MIIANILGIMALLFFLWKRLKEDYHYEKIFNLGAAVVAGYLLGLLISKQFLPIYWFWIEFLAIVAFFVFSINRQKIKFFESFDGLVVGLLPWLGLYFFGHSIVNQSLSSFLAAWVMLIFIFLFFLLDSSYRRFLWYKSGRVGFSGILITALFFLVRSVSAVIYPSIISLSGKYEVYLSGTVAFGFFLILYNLSRSKE